MTSFLAAGAVPPGTILTAGPAPGHHLEPAIPDTRTILIHQPPSLYVLTARTRASAQCRLIALILVECLVTEDAPKWLICMGQQLAALGSNAGLGTVDLTVLGAAL